MKVLIVEDNPLLAGRLKDNLKKWHLPEVANSGHDGLRLFSEAHFDLVILDLGLPDMEGAEVCQQMRRLSMDVPILIVTGVDNTASKVQLLEIGADDYITKPFDPTELLARVNALARRKLRGKNNEFIKLGDLVINPAKRTVVRGGIAIKLRRKEFDILEYLALNRGRVLSRQMILEHVWPSTSVSWTGSVDVHIKQLRDKVDKPFPHKLIKTTYGVGYSVEIPALSKA